MSSGTVPSVMPLIAAALVAAIICWHDGMKAGVGPALIIAVGAIVGTFMLLFSKEYFSEPLATLLLVVVIERMLAERPATAGLAMGAAVLTRPQTLLFAPTVIALALGVLVVLEYLDTGWCPGSPSRSERFDPGHRVHLSHRRSRARLRLSDPA
jgi:hypothetical protein